MQHAQYHLWGLTFLRRRRTGSMLEDNRDEDDQDHYDGLGGQLDEISDELIDRGVKDW